MNTNEIRVRDGKLYHVCVTTMSATPERAIMWWPLDATPDQYSFRTGKSVGEGQPCEHRGSGIVSSGGQYWKIVGGGNAVAEIIETEDVPPPAQRGKKLSTRWESGRWQKLTAKGWVDA